MVSLAPPKHYSIFNLILGFVFVFDLLEANGVLGGIGRPLFHYKNHPIKWVRVTGVVVAVDEYAGKNVYTVDDSSGMCVECVCVAPTPAPKEPAIAIPNHLNQIAAIHNQASTSSTNTKKEMGKKEKKDGRKKR